VAGRISALFAVALVLLIGSSALAPGGAALQEASPAAGADCPATTAAENEALVQRLYDEAWNQGHLEVLDELLAANYIHHAPGLSAYLPVRQSPDSGKDDLAASIEEFRGDFPDVHFTIEEMIATDDAVVVRMVANGTQADTLDAWNAPNTGRAIARPTWAIYHIACGKLSEGWALPDNLTMLRQLGVITDDEFTDAGTPTVATPVP
jgi:steroid delta-isomerase-like uncharacterized protein